MTVTAGDLQARAVADKIQHEFPGVTVWYGCRTWHWWALVWCRGWRLVEAITPEELGQALKAPRGWPWPRS